MGSIPIRGLLQAGRRSAGPHKAGIPVRVRGLQLVAEYANRQSGQVESLVMSVGSTPTSATLIPWSSGNDSWPTPRKRRSESFRDHWSASVAAAPLRGKEAGWVQVPGGPLESWAAGPIRDDAWFAPRKSGFNSPAVHSKPLAALQGLWSNGTTPAWRAGDPGSTPGGSTATEATASGYAALVANQAGGRSPVLRVRLSPLPLVPRW